MLRLSRPVIIHSPLPYTEAESRLKAVTSDRGHLRFLDPSTAGHPDPLLRGWVTAEGVRLARFSETLGQNSFVAWFDGDLQPAPDGGTDLRGELGLHRGAQVLSYLMIVIGPLILVPMLGYGLLLVARGQLGGLPFVLGPLGMAAFAWQLWRTGLRFLRADEPRLQSVLETILSPAPKL